MNKVTNKHREEILKEMFIRVGADYNEELVQQEGWFQKYSWSKEEEEDYKEWLINYLVKNLKIPKTMAEESSSWFLLDVGWKYDEN